MRSLIKQIHIPLAWDRAGIVENVWENQIHPLEFGFSQNVSIRSQGGVLWAAPSSEKIFTSVSKRGLSHYLASVAVLLDH